MNIMKTISYSIILLFFYPHFTAGMEKKVKLIPICKNIAYEDGPLIPLDVARQYIQSLATMLYDITQIHLFYHSEKELCYGNT